MTTGGMAGVLLVDMLITAESLHSRFEQDEIQMSVGYRKIHTRKAVVDSLEFALSSCPTVSSTCKTENSRPPKPTTQ